MSKVAYASNFNRTGRVLDRHGYVQIKMYGHPRANINGYVLEHILVLEKSLGRPILPTEATHHIDGNRSNNVPGNLILFKTNKMHLAFHRRLKAFEVSGHWDWRQCEICHHFDDTEKLSSCKAKSQSWTKTRFYHQACNAQRALERYHKKPEK